LRDCLLDYHPGKYPIIFMEPKQGIKGVGPDASIHIL
jgi:hypothetical protein